MVIFAFIAPLISVWVWEQCSPRQGFFLGWLLGAAIFAFAGYWLPTAPRELAGITTPYAELLTVAVIFLVTVSTGIVASVYSLLKASFSYRLRLLLLLPALWVLADYLRAWLFTGFPWFNIGYTAIDTPLAAWASVFGVHGLTWLVVLTGSALALTVSHVNRTNIFISVVVLSVIWGGGLALKQVSWTTEEGKPLHVALMQTPNWGKGIDDVEAWKAFITQSKAVLERVDLVVWSETIANIWLIEIDQETPDTYIAGDNAVDKAIWQKYQLELDGIPRSFAMAKYQNTLLFDVLEKQLEANNKNMILGIEFNDNQRNLSHNSALVLGNHKRSLYDKKHLIPFGEYFPFLTNIRKIWPDFNLLEDHFSAARNQSNLVTVGDHLASLSICYESAYGSDLITAMPQANYIVMISNDSMFANTPEIAQHQQIVRMRALEAGRWLVRANGYGITAIINPQGNVIQSLPIAVHGVIEGAIQPMSGATPYARWQDYPVLILIFLTIVLGFIRFFKTALRINI
jgi:apolipoprotein N-acyltransferase